MKEKIRQLVIEACLELYDLEIIAELTRPDSEHGDFASNVAMQLAKPLGSSPRDIAQEIVGVLKENELIALAGVAGPGFINISVTDQTLIESLKHKPAKSMAGMNVIAEYSDPNVFKVLHVGHLYTSVVGDAISNVIEDQGGIVHRVNFGGDVGLHAAKAMWGIVEKLGGESPNGLNGVEESKRADWISEAYVAGNSAYESGDSKAEIISINKRIYDLHKKDAQESDFASIYWTCRQWCYDYFDAFYDRIGTSFEKYYPESITAPLGLKTVKEQLKNGIYEESDGAVVFDGEKHGLHTRVFINSNGLPTYEAKDVGLAMMKWQDYNFDLSIMITGNDIKEYMKVVLKSIEQYEPEIAKRSVHKTHGMVKLKGGEKMSSRLGNAPKAVDILDEVRRLIGKEDNSTMLAAVKYGFLKQGIGQDIAFDINESVATEGNSGPYLQYAHARAVSILGKSTQELQEFSTDTKLDSSERTLLRKITEYPEIIELATKELAPHHICTYLYELAQTFNRFYENSKVIGSDRETERLQLVKAYAETLKKGLTLLGIHAPQQM